MTHRYLMVLAALTLAMCATTAPAAEELTVDAYKNCIGLMQTGGAYAAVTPGLTYTVTVDGNAQANPNSLSVYDGVFCYYYDQSRPNHPMVKYLPKTEQFTFTATSAGFYAFLADKTLKDVADNLGSMTVTLTPGGREQRLELTVDGVFNCLGLEDFGSAKIILIPGTRYTASVTGDASTNGSGDGFFDGVCVFYREYGTGRHPIIDVLDVGETITFRIHETGWLYAFLVDDSFNAVGNNDGTFVVRLEEDTPVEDGTWSSIKSLFR
ncbi:MAG: hypothetical protein FJY74_07105 [Candidatus Eisenbacteria bacterium]|nr:hypothetical protein [Candidatus Eisenbacteria bacterium]